MAVTTWTASLDAQLRQLWDEGCSSAQIGVRMGLTKNAVIGRAHRLELPSRESPIRSTLKSERAAGRRAEMIAQARTMHADGFATRQIAARIGVRVDKAARILRDIGLGLPPVSHLTAPKPEARATPAPPAAIFKPIAARSCCWPMWGDKERPTHCYCHAPTTTRRDGVPDVYCAAHRLRATVRTMHPVTAPRRAA